MKQRASTLRAIYIAAYIFWFVSLAVGLATQGTSSPADNLFIRGAEVLFIVASIALIAHISLLTLHPDKEE